MAARTGRTGTARRTAARTRTTATGTRGRRAPGGKLDSLRSLFVEEIRDLYDAEHQVLKALPKMIRAVSNPDVKRSLESHRRETEEHVRRLERIFEQSGVPARASRCEGMAGIIQEGTEVVQASADPDVRDAAIVEAAQKVEHYEIAGYGTVRSFAGHLHLEDSVGLLQQTLEEEKQADRRLTDIAERSSNVEAARKEGARAPAGGA